MNHFHAAGGMGFLMQELLNNGLLHGDVKTVMGNGLAAYTQEPWLDDGALAWRPVPTTSADTAVLRPVSEPFSADGGLRLLQGNLGRSVVKVSAVAPEHRVVRAPAVVVSDQQDLLALFNAGKINKDLIAVVRYQGPRANGMPELHKLTPPLAVLQDQGFKVALVTDGRMSGASGKVPAAIHLSPEALADGPIARVMDGDMITLDCERGVLEVEVDASHLRGPPGLAPRPQPQRPRHRPRPLRPVPRQRLCTAESRRVPACLATAPELDTTHHDHHLLLPPRLSSPASCPCIVLADPAHAVPLAHALLEGGIDVMEITLRSDAALKSIEAGRQGRAADAPGRRHRDPRGRGAAGDRRGRHLRTLARRDRPARQHRQGRQPALHPRRDDDPARSCTAASRASR